MTECVATRRHLRGGSVTVTAQEASLMRGFNPGTPYLFDLYHELWTRIHYNFVPQCVRWIWCPLVQVSTDGFDARWIPKRFLCGILAPIYRNRSRRRNALCCFRKNRSKLFVSSLPHIAFPPSSPLPFGTTVISLQGRDTRGPFLIVIWYKAQCVR